jgi:anhydro-N-acetylmuramic acid kinase
MSTQELGQDPDFLEAISFAILANQTIEGEPVSFKMTTGANKPGILGKICLP